MAQLTVNPIGVALMDDSSLGVASQYAWDPDLSASEIQQATIQHPLEHLTRLAQHWERLLFTTGGAINLKRAIGT